MHDVFQPLLLFLQSKTSLWRKVGRMLGSGGIEGQKKKGTMYVIIALAIATEETCHHWYWLQVLTAYFAPPSLSILQSHYGFTTCQIWVQLKSCCFGAFLTNKH
jgi:hypothetical protein